MVCCLYSNTGLRGGKFLERSRVAKPGSSLNNPEFYKPQDFIMGARIEAFKHKFIIEDADEYVLKYMEDNCAEFPAEVRDSLKEKHPKYKPSANNS